jgi:hypothetical protein
VQATVPVTDNTMLPRTQGCIAGVPPGNLTGSVKMLCLGNHRVITRDQFRILPMPDLVVSHLISIATSEGYGITSSAPSWSLMGLPYDVCCLNKVGASGHQLTVTLHVDDLKITSVSQSDIDAFVEHLRAVYKEVKVNTGKVINYVGMTFDYREDGQVRITMENCVACSEWRESTPTSRLRHIILHGIVIVSGGQWSRWQLVGWVAGLRLSRMSALVFGHPCLREVCRRLNWRHYRSVRAGSVDGLWWLRAGQSIVGVQVTSGRIHAALVALGGGDRG